MDVRNVTKGLSQFSIACGSVQALGSSATVDNQTKWKKPTGGSLKLNVDTLVRMGNDEVGIGAIIRDSEGMVVAGFGRRVTGFFSPHIAECLALREGLSFDLVLGF
ncbi:hypothetical protein TIFTF001_055958 [Ficus carica]|uniref:RNase H type-1 domain-containing protein n=1 Tax=Ficus carica TaxID=3494 RepID=A0AA88ECC1_FICCA|nr:hypothetical protein TIFTF001_055958 [Ficus carica]